MAENLIVNKGNKARLNEIPILAGAITAIIDTRELYIDYGDNNPEYRVKITDVEVIDADSKDLSSNKIIVNPIINKLYCFTKSQDIWTYINTNWIKVGGIKNSAFTLITGTLSDETKIGAKSLVNLSGTAINLSDVTLGSLIIDKNRSTGIVTAINGSSVTVKRLVDNKKINTLTQHIYIDSAYDDIEVGTIEKPFKSFANLMAAKSDYLSDNEKKIIHLVSNNCSINTTNTINNCEFISESYSFEHEFKLTGNNINLTLSNCTITDYFDIKADIIYLNNCNFKSVYGGEAKIKTNLLKAMNVYSELSESIKLYSYDYTDTNTDAEFNFYNSNIANVQLSDATIINVNFNNSIVSLSQESGIDYKYNLNLINTEVYYLRNLTTTGNIYFYSGTLRSETNQPIIKATNIYLGAFDFGLLVPIFNGNIIEQSGVTSKQVFDTKVRTYGNNEVNLESHLDAIDNKFQDIDLELHGNSESNVNLKEAFISADTFDLPETLLNTSYRIGDVVKYTGYETIQLINEFELTLSDEANAIEQINVTNVNDDGSTTSIPYISVKFNMENSKFFAKLFDNIIVRYNTTIENDNPTLGTVYTLSIYSIGSNWIKARIAKSELHNDDTLTNKKYFVSNRYTQSIDIEPNDRILKLSNGWDKLSASDSFTEIKKGFHHEIDTYIEHGFYLIKLDEEYYKQNNLSIPLNFTPYYLLVVEKNGVVDSLGNKIITQYMFDGNSIKSREKEDANIQIGFDEVSVWTEWIEYATTTELELLQEKIDTKVDFRAIYRDELDDFVTLANVMLKVIGETRPEEGHVIVNPYWKDYYIIVQGTQIGNGKYSVSNFMTKADGIYVRTGIIDIPMGTKTWSEWEKYVTKSEFDSKLANIKKNPNSTDGDIIDTHLTVGYRIGNIGENSFVCGTYLQDESNEGNEASGFASVSIGGSNNVASADYTAVIGGVENIANTTNAAVVGGAENVASNYYAAVVGGSINTANGLRSISLGGYGNTANDENSITLGGCFNVALRNQVKAGFYAKDGVAGNGVDGDAFIIGNGSNNKTRSNCFRVAYDGYVYGGKTFGADSADIAELYEWQDGNPNNEDRRGLFVTLDGTKIKLASSADTYIKGVISALPCLAGDTYSDSWHNKYMKDIFGVPLKQLVHHEAEYKDGKLIHEAYDSEEYIINPDYDPEQEYIPREQRPEYDYVSNWGKLVLVDDGTCEVNGFATVGQGGKATKSDKQTLYRVMERKDSTHIYVSIG